MDLKWPTEIHNLKIHINYEFFMVFQSSPCGLGIFYGMDMDLISNPSGPTDCERPLN